MRSQINLKKIEIIPTTYEMTWINFNVNRSLAQQFCQIACQFPHFTTAMSQLVYTTYNSMLPCHELVLNNDVSHNDLAELKKKINALNIELFF
jgi:hypothetical protein